MRRAAPFRAPSPSPASTARRYQSRACWGSSPGAELELCVPAGHWQSACPAGDREVLVSCLVTPGFDFADFALLAP
ncbi:cupin domain-containing protein [Streptomyces avidinii]